MAVLITVIKRFQGLHADVKPTDAPAGSTFYEIDTGDWFVWDAEGESWETYTFPLLDATSPTLPTTGEKAALSGADSPDAGNVYATASAVDDAIAAALTNLLSALPTVDPASAGELWNNSGVLTVSVG